MDIISYQKGMKAKAALEALNKRLGNDVQDIHSTVKQRLESIEARDLHITLNNSVSALENNISSSLNKHNLKVKSILNTQRFGLKELSFDGLSDATNIDSTKSVNYTFDGAGKKIKATNPLSPITVVTRSEPVTTAPSMINVSLAWNEAVVINTPTVYVSRDDGVTWKVIEINKMTRIDDLPVGTQIRIKVQLEGTHELQAYSYSWI